MLERIYQFTGDNVNLGEWSSSNLNVFIPVIEKAVEHIAAETRAPGHYLLTNAEVPATGYEVAEAGLVSKTIERISFLKSPIRDICSIAMRYENDVAEADIIADSKVQFATPQYRSETLMADAMPEYSSSASRSNGSRSRWAKARTRCSASCACAPTRWPTPNSNR